MVKREIKETVREYDESGNLVRETITETSETDYNTLSAAATTYSWNGGGAIGATLPA